MTNEEYQQNRDTIKSRYLGKYGIHAVGGAADKDEIRVYSLKELEQKIKTELCDLAENCKIVFKIQSIPEADTEDAE